MTETKLLELRSRYSAGDVVVLDCDGTLCMECTWYPHWDSLEPVRRYRVELDDESIRALRGVLEERVG